MSIFKELLAIKAFREGQAESAMRMQRSIALEASDKREAAEALLARLLAEGVDKEHRMYRDLCERIVKLRDIENVQQSVAALRARELQQQDNVDAAIRVLDEENQKLDTVRAAHKEASRQKSKFVDLSHNHTNELAREAERKEDLELEEVANIKRDREDWEEYAEGEQ